MPSVSARVIGMAYFSQSVHSSALSLTVLLKATRLLPTPNPHDSSVMPCSEGGKIAPSGVSRLSMSLGPLFHRMSVKAALGEGRRHMTPTHILGLINSGEERRDDAFHKDILTAVPQTGTVLGSTT